MPRDPITFQEHRKLVEVLYHAHKFLKVAIAVKTILVYRSTFMVFSFGLPVELLLGIFFFRFEISG